MIKFLANFIYRWSSIFKIINVLIETPFIRRHPYRLLLGLFSTPFIQNVSKGLLPSTFELSNIWTLSPENEPMKQSSSVSGQIDILIKPRPIGEGSTLISPMDIFFTGFSVKRKYFDMAIVIAQRLRVSHNWRILSAWTCDALHPWSLPRRHSMCPCVCTVP